MRRNEENWNNFWQIAILYGFWDSKKIIFTIQDKRKTKKQHKRRSAYICLLFYLYYLSEFLIIPLR